MELLQNSMELLIAKSIILQTTKMRKLSMEVPQNSIQLNRWIFYKTPYKWNIHAILINHQMPKFLKVETFPINQGHWSLSFSRDLHILIRMKLENKIVKQKLHSGLNAQQPGQEGRKKWESVPAEEMLRNEEWLGKKKKTWFLELWAERKWWERRAKIRYQRHCTILRNISEGRSGIIN